MRPLPETTIVPPAPNLTLGNFEILACELKPATRFKNAIRVVHRWFSPPEAPHIAHYRRHGPDGRFPPAWSRGCP